MNILYKNRYYIAFITSLILFFLIILGVQSYYNLNHILQPASDKWGRSTSLGANDLYKKQPSIVMDEQYVNVLTSNKSNFTYLKIDRTSRMVEKATIKLKGVEPYKVQKFIWDIENIYFTESNSLYYSTKNPAGGYSSKLKIADDVLDFEVTKEAGGLIIAAANSDGISIYKQVGKNFEQQGIKYNIPKIKNLAMVQDNQSNLHIAAYAEVDAVNIPVYYLTFSNSNWSLKGKAIEKSLSGSWSMNNIDIGIDNTDTYIFYEMRKWDQFGFSAKTYYSTVPLYENETNIVFNKFTFLDKDINDSTAIINEPRLLKVQQENIKLSIVVDSYDKKKGTGFSGYMVSMNNGKIESTTRTTLNQRLVTETVFEKYKDDYVFLYLDAAGSFTYEPFYIETGKAYNINAGTPTKDDYSVAVMETIPGYISTVLVSFIKFTLYFPAILWFLVIEFFEIKRMRDRPKLTFSIGFVIYLAIKLLTFGTYYSAVSIPQMPPMLTFTGAKYFYAVSIAVIALLIEKLLKKHNPEMHMIAEYIVFALIDIEYTNLIYAAYMV